MGRRRWAIAVCIVALVIIGTGLVIWRSPTPDDPRVGELRGTYGIDVVAGCLAPCISNVRLLVRDAARTLHLGDLVARLGYPERVIAYPSGGGEEISSIYAFYYVSKGVSFRSLRTFRPPEHVKDELKPDLEILDISLWNSRTFEALANEIRGTYGTATYFEQAQPWSGYGTINIVTPKYR